MHDVRVHDVRMVAGEVLPRTGATVGEAGEERQPGTQMTEATATVEAEGPTAKEEAVPDRPAVAEPVEAITKDKPLEDKTAERKWIRPRKRKSCRKLKALFNKSQRPQQHRDAEDGQTCRITRRRQCAESSAITRKGGTRVISACRLAASPRITKARVVAPSTQNALTVTEIYLECTPTQRKDKAKRKGGASLGILTRSLQRRKFPRKSKKARTGNQTMSRRSRNPPDDVGVQRR